MMTLHLRILSWALIFILHLGSSCSDFEFSQAFAFFRIEDQRFISKSQYMIWSYNMEVKIYKILMLIWQTTSILKKWENLKFQDS